MSKVMKKYSVQMHGGSSVQVEILSGEDFTTLYKAYFPEISKLTLRLLDDVKEDLLKTMKISPQEVFELKSIQHLEKELIKNSEKFIKERLPHITKTKQNTLVSYLINDMIGLGPIELLIEDPNLEEIAINTSKEPLWVYHKEFGWLKTNIIVQREDQIQNYASIIGRRVGRQITTLNPLLDAHLITGDRANATLFPVSTKGNTITIRKFARRPWTITDFIENQTLTADIAAFIWLCMQYELNAIVAGGTSSGKTALLNTLMPFIQPNHRIVSIEDTRELQLPDFLHWVPLTTRLANAEGQGSITMLNLMINSLRMRPDRIVVGEIRRSDQAEVLFEAMHTGHSVYATLHAETAEQVIRRMTSPPINIPPSMLEALHLILVQYRDRRRGIRRTYQLAELLPSNERSGESIASANVLYRLKPNNEVIQHNKSIRIFDTIKMHTGMNDRELSADLSEKTKILNWMVKSKINNINDVGKAIAQYYSDKEQILKKIK